MPTQTRISIAEIDRLVLFGRNDQNLALIEEKFGVNLVARGDQLRLNGSAESIRSAAGLLHHLIERVSQGDTDADELKSLIQQNPALPVSEDRHSVRT